MLILGGGCLSVFSVFFFSFSFGFKAFFYGPALAHCLSASVSFYARTSILCTSNVSQRAESGSAKDIREGKKKHKEGDGGGWRGIEEAMGEVGGWGEKVREDHTYENARGKVFRASCVLGLNWDLWEKGAVLSGRLVDSKRWCGGYTEVTCRLCVGVIRRRHRWMIYCETDILLGFFFTLRVQTGGWHEVLWFIFLRSRPTVHKHSSSWHLLCRYVFLACLHESKYWLGPDWGWIWQVQSEDTFFKLRELQETEIIRGNCLRSSRGFRVSGAQTGSKRRFWGISEFDLAGVKGVAELSYWLETLLPGQEAGEAEQLCKWFV